MILSIDPGIRGSGLAIWTMSGELYSAWYAPGNTRKPPEAWIDMTKSVFQSLSIQNYRPKILIIELPQVYDRRTSKGDPNDLIQLAAVVGAISQLLYSQGTKVIVTYLPREWKNQLPKEISEERTRASLDQNELRKINLPSAKSLSHNVWDGIGIGLHYLKINGIRK